MKRKWKNLGPDSPSQSDCYQIEATGKIARGYQCTSAISIHAGYHFNGSGPQYFGGADRWPVATMIVSFQDGEIVKRDRFIKAFQKFMDEFK